MAKYKIDSLNKITSGQQRNFIDMDVTLDTSDMDIVEYVHLLQLEDKMPHHRVRKGDILLEQNKGVYKVTEFLSKEFNIPTQSLSSIEGTVDLSSLSHAISKIDDKNAIILNEQQEMYVEDSIDSVQYIRLILSCCSEDYRNSLLKILKTEHGIGRIYECENAQDNQDTNVLVGSGVINPIYDTYDLHFKSRSKIRNSYLKSFDEKTPNRTEDIYLPESAQIKSICQSEDSTIALTNTTNESVQMLSCSLNGITTGSRYNMQINSRKMKTFLFPSKAAIADKYDEQLSDASYADLLAYFQTDEAARVYGSRSTDNFSKPVVNLANVEYNYIASIPMNNVVSEYSNGNVYCDIYNTKNVYNSTYSMEMSSIGSLLNCRDYIDIQTCGGKVYLKYYDNINYTTDGDVETPDMDNLSSISLVRNKGGSYPYQKVESFSPVVVQSQKHHKSLFFSVNIGDVTMESENDTAQSIALKNTIKHDITSAIKEIARNVSPANTQLFEVYFGETF